MADPDQLRRAIAAEEQLRGTVPDDVIDATVAALQAQLPNPDSPGEGRRRPITVLFADVSGFTALSETRDAELVMDLMNSLWQQLDVIVEQHGGRVDKHIGDALMAIWGAETAREDDAERAVQAALGLQAALAEFRTRTGDQLAMRVGVNTGPALVGAVGTTGELSAIGDAVNVASRLEHAAPVGGILISHDTWRHVRGHFEVDPVGRLQVKGKQDGVDALIVTRARPRAYRMATRGIEGVATHTIGRDRELDQLRATFRTVQETGTARVVTVVGDAGIGKSRLLDEFDSWIDLLPESVRFFAGRSFANRAQTPFALVRSLVATRFDILDSDPAATVRAKLRDGFAATLDEDEAEIVGHWIGLDVGQSDAVDRLAGRAEVSAVARSHLVAYFRALLAEDPVLVILEDLHWADDESLDLLAGVVDQLADTPMLVVGVARPEFLERHAPRPDEVRIDLDALAPEATNALVREVLQRAVDVPDELVDLIVLRADGNAFFIEELVSMLIDQGVIVADDAEWHIDLDRLDADSIPATLTAVLLARLDGLAHEELRALQHAAVVGRVFWDAAVAALGPNDGDVVDALVAARDRAFVFTRQPSSFRTTTEYVFKHALLRDVAYETVLLRDRPPLHRAAAEWIEAIAGDRVGEFRELVADHYLRAEEPARAYANLLAAGLAWRAKAHFGPARRGLQQAFALAPEVGERIPPEATIAMGEVCYRLGDLDAAQRVLDDVIDGCDDRVVVADAQFWSSRIAETRGQSARERDLLDRARAELESVGGLTYGRVLAALTQWEAHHGDLDTAREIGRRALEASEPDSIARTEAHAALVVATSLGDDLDEATEHARAAAEAARRTGDLQLEASTLTNLGVMAHLRGDEGDDSQYELADRYYEEAAALARRIDMPALVGVTALNRAQVAVRQRRLDDAAVLVRESMQCAVRSGARVDMVFVTVIEADRLAELGRVDDALDLLAVAHRDPAANAQSRHEIEQVTGRLGVPVTDATGRQPRPGEDLDAVIARLLG